MIEKHVIRNVSKLYLNVSKLLGNIYIVSNKMNEYKAHNREKCSKIFAKRFSKQIEMNAYLKYS